MTDVGVGSGALLGIFFSWWKCSRCGSD